MLTPELRSQVRKLWDKFWANGMANHVIAITQMTYLIFMKLLEDYENDRIKAAKKAGRDYSSVFDDNDEMRWSVWKDWPGPKMLKHVRDEVFPFIKTLGVKDSDFSVQLKNANFEIQSPVLLEEAVSVIESMHISEQEKDIQGEIFEYLLSELETAGLNGQFRTPRHIIRMMVKFVDPDVGQKICDPACGTGGFLVNAYLHIMKKYTKKEQIEYNDDGVPHHLIGDLLTEQQEEILYNEQFYGYDFENVMTSISGLNMLLNGFNKPNIEFVNTLSKSFEHKPIYDIVLANPPFSGYLEKSDINENFDVSTTKTELLFLQLFYNLLVTGGQACVIVPEGALFGTSNAHKKVRQNILENCRVDAVISMPSGVFKPYAGVATSVIFFTKGEKTKKVWFYQMENDGYTLDDKRLKIDKNDIPDILEKFEKNAISEKSWIASFNEIKNTDWSLSAARYKPYIHQEIEYQDPVEIINEIARLEVEMQSDLKELKDKMANA